MPLRHESGLTRSIAYRQAPGRLVSASAQVCGFVAMRGSSDSTGHSVRLADDITLTVASDAAGDTALGQALSYPGPRAMDRHHDRRRPTPSDTSTGGSPLHSTTSPASPPEPASAALSNQPGVGRCRRL
jgi:hypothetical protein